MMSSHYQCPTSWHDAFFRYATGGEVRKAFREHREELAWLAVFLTANTELANVCLVDACAVAATPSDVCPLWLESWTRCCTIRSAVEMQQSRISLLASAYECTPCPHRDHTPLAPLVLAVLYDKPERFGRCLDVLRRAAVVLIGIEHYSPTESAHILGISGTAVEAAYCAALDFFDILHCEMLGDLDMGVPCC